MWGQRLARSVDENIAQEIWPFIAREPFTRAQLTAAMAAMYPYMLAFVSDGTGNHGMAQSVAGAFYYLDGTAV